MNSQDAVFIITEENQCPLYNAGDEFSLEGIVLTFTAAKPTCLTLAKDIIRISEDEVALEHLEQGGKTKTRFECGGCRGLIRFEYKREKEYATLQMKLLAAAERKTKLLGISQFAELLRSIETFESLSNEDLLDLASLLDVAHYDYGFPIVQKGSPGQNLYIILSGHVDVLDDDGIALNIMNEGAVFGEMSLLTGEMVSATIMAAGPCTIASMNQKNFRYILQKFPVLQVFFYKLMVRRITEINVKRAEELGSGMAGHLSDIPPIELCQMINSIQKSGKLHFETDDHNGILQFFEGEIVAAEIDGLSGKDAFFKILLLRKGRFVFTQGISRKESQQEIIGGFMTLMMEGMKWIDERQQKW